MEDEDDEDEDEVDSLSSPHAESSAVNERTRTPIQDPRPNRAAFVWDIEAISLKKAKEPHRAALPKMQASTHARPIILFRRLSPNISFRVVNSAGPSDSTGSDVSTAAGLSVSNS